MWTEVFGRGAEGHGQQGAGGAGNVNKHAHRHAHDIKREKLSETWRFLFGSSE